MFVSSMGPVKQLHMNGIHDNVYLRTLDDDEQEILRLSTTSSSSSEEHYHVTEVLSNQRQILFDKALGRMLTRHFYLTEHEFSASDHFEGWVYTYNRHRYKVIVSSNFSCSCRRFQRDYVCKHFLFILKRIFNVNLHSFDLRLAIMQYHHFTSNDLEHIFRGQVRRLCPIVKPVSESTEKENLSLTLKRQSIDPTDVCPICFERLLINDRKLVTCFHSCGKSMHKNCMNEWKRVKGKSTNCPLCQAPWIESSATEKAVLDHYAHRSYPIDGEDKYVLCCLYTPPNWC